MRSNGLADGGHANHDCIRIWWAVAYCRWFPSPSARRAVKGIANLETLDRYVERVVTATSVGEVLEDKPR
jgi:hypothetical protein